MAVSSLGDLAQSFMLQRRSVALRQDMARLTQELSSGRVADVRDVLAGNHSYLTGIERSLETLGSYNVASTEAGQFSAAMQTALERIQDIGGSLGTDLLTAGNGSVGVIAGRPSDQAAAQLGSIISVLNGDIAGRSLFAGQATDRAPLASADTLLTTLRGVVAGQPSPDAMMAAAAAWFDDPSGFAATMYSGAATGLAPFALSDTDRISLDLRADDAAFGDVLRNTAMAALAQDPALGLDVAGQTALFGLAGEGLLTSQDKLTAVRAQVGFVEARIEEVTTRNAAERTSFEYARGALLAADPFETATKLEDVQFQLQSLYTVTVRTSQLSLVNFL